LGLGTALSLMGDATLYAVLPTHTADAGVVLGGVGILLGANRAVRILLNGPAGLAYDRSLRRRLYVPALFVGALSTAIYAATSGFWPLLAGRLLWGLAWSGIWVGGTTMILDVTTDRDRGRWTGLYQTWFFLGGAGGALAGGLLTDLVGFTATMWIASGVTAFGAWVALLFLPETRGHQPKESRQQDTALPGAAQLPPGSLRPRENRGLWVVASLQGVNRFIASGVLAATLGLLVQGWLTDAPAAARGAAVGVATLTGILSASRAGLSMFAAPLAGMASDRLGNRWAIVGGSLVLGAASMVLLAVGLRPPAILAGIALAALVRGATQAMTSALTGDLVHEQQRGRAIGLVHTASDLGSALGPPVAYALLPWAGLKGVYLICAAVFVAELGLVLVHRMKEKRTGTREPTCCAQTVEH
jgi:MFS family permease